MTSYFAAFAIGSQIIPGSFGAEIALKIIGVFIVAGIMGALAAGLLSGVRGQREWAATAVLTFAAMLPVVGVGPLRDPCPTNERPAIPGGLAYATRDSAICIVTSGGTTQRIYQGGGSLLGGLGWSPDGGELTFDDYDRPEGERWLSTSADGSGRRALADRPSWAASQSWPRDVVSPDGAWVAHDDAYVPGITVRARDGGDDRIVSGGLDALRPGGRSPDSEWLAFQTGEGWPTIPDVWVVRRDGSSLTRLALGANFPAWRPAVGP